MCVGPGVSGINRMWDRAGPGSEQGGVADDEGSVYVHTVHPLTDRSTTPLSTLSSSHVVPFSKLFTDTKERVQCLVSTLAMVAAGLAVYFGLGGDWHKIGACVGIESRPCSPPPMPSRVIRADRMAGPWKMDGRACVSC